MAHYDCNNCGEPGGIAFGTCTKCTPNEYLKLNSEKICLYLDARKYAEDSLKEQKEILIGQYLKTHNYDAIEKRMLEIEESSKN